MSLPLVIPCRVGFWQPCPFRISHWRVHFNLPNANSVERKGLVIWLSGLSSAGKSTIGKELLRRLQTSGHQAELLDGEMLRQGLCKDLSFSEADRNENVRRIGFV